MHSIYRLIKCSSERNIKLIKYVFFVHGLRKWVCICIDIYINHAGAIECQTLIYIQQEDETKQPSPSNQIKQRDNQQYLFNNDVHVFTDAPACRICCRICYGIERSIKRK